MTPTEESLRSFALGFPSTTEEFPWGERALKVSGKVFVFLYAGPDALKLTVKLKEHHAEALSYPEVRPTGYNLGKSGWVTASFPHNAEIPMAMIQGWITESWELVAPRRLVKARQNP